MQQVRAAPDPTHGAPHAPDTHDPAPPLPDNHPPPPQPPRWMSVAPLSSSSPPFLPLPPPPSGGWLTTVPPSMSPPPDPSWWTTHPLHMLPDGATLRACVGNALVYECRERVLAGGCMRCELSRADVLGVEARIARYADPVAAAARTDDSAFVLLVLRALRPGVVDVTFADTVCGRTMAVRRVRIDVQASDHPAPRADPV